MSEELKPAEQDARAEFSAWVQSKAPQERELSLFDAWQAATARQQAEIEEMQSDIGALAMAATSEAVRVNELTPVLSAAQNLIKVKGRHHSEQAYQRLVAAVDAATGVKA